MADEDDVFLKAMRQLDGRRPDDDAVFAEAMRDLQARPAEGEPPEDPFVDDDATFAAAVEALDAPPEDPPAPPEEDRTPPYYFGTPQALRRRIRQGLIKPQEELDLHRLRRDEAHRHVVAFIRAATARRLDVVRIICGRGLHSADQAVLGPELDGWLSQELRPPVREVVVPPPAHGGDGARYVFLVRAPEA